MRFRRNDDEGVEVAMTPIIDCVFLLLIFFLVATVLKDEEELPIEPPETTHGLEAPADAEPFVIGVDIDGRPYIDNEPVTIEVLHDEVRAIAASDPGRKVRIDCDRRTMMQDYLMVHDLCLFEGLERVYIRTRPPKDG